MQVTKLSGFLLATDVTRYGYPKDLVSGNTQQQHKNQGLCTQRSSVSLVDLAILHVAAAPQQPAQDCPVQLQPPP